MWNKLPFCNYFIEFSVGVFYEIFVTDFINIWTKHYTQQDFFEDVKKSNRILEDIDDAVLLSKAKEMLVNVDSLKRVNITQIDCDTLLLDAMKSFGYPVKLKINLTLGPKELFFQKVTYRLLKTVQDLKSSETELSNLLLSKDKEIKEYKDEGGRIVLFHLKTPQYSESQHSERHSVYTQHFGFKEIPKDVMDKFGNDVNRNSKEHTDLKPEEISQINVKTEQNGIVNPEASSSSRSTNKIVKEELTKQTLAAKEEIASSLKEEQNSQSSVSPRKKSRKMFKL